ncbi:hypothetical protein T09_11804 [Trichinella sp. T9]|nr:hypothetical protein T09_11804 [Trichinella sp. T9]
MDSTIEDEFVTAASQLDDSRDEVSHLLSNCSHSPSCLSTETAFSNVHRDQSNLLADGHSCTVDACGPWHPKYFNPPVSGCRLPGVAKALLPVLVAVGRSLVCFTLSLAFFALVTLLIPFRFFFYLIGRFSNLPLFHRTFYKRHCDPLWPFGSPPDRHHATTTSTSNKHHRRHQPSLYYLLSLSLDSGLDLKALQDFLLQRLLLCTSRHALICCDPDGATQSSKPFPIEDHFCVSMPEQQWNDDDAGANLEQTLNQLIKSTLPDQWRVYMMSTRSLAPTTSMNVLIRSTWADACLCPLELLSLIGGGGGGDQQHLVQSSVKIEPKIFFTVPCAFGMLTSFILAIACATQDMLNGPINLLTSMVTSVHPVWNDLIEFRGLPSLESRGENQTKWKLTWTKITSLDQVLRLCKILRCSIQELLLSVLAGALRRHFRSRGIRHPPALVISMPIDIGKQHSHPHPHPHQQQQQQQNKADEMRQNCDKCVVVPLKLPVDVDGAVPRVWKTQEALNSTLDSSFPQAATFFLNTISTVLPASLAHRCARMLYKSSEGLVSFLQVEKNYHLCGRNLNTLLLFPVVGELSGWAKRKFACTLTHLNSEIYVSLNVDPRHFQEPKQLVGYMQNEIHHLLAQMGARLLNLSELSYLPCFLRNARLNSPPTPASSVCRAVAPPVTSCSSSTAVVDGDKVEISMEVVGTGKRRKKSKKVSVGELERLLGEVQNDLHSIKTSHFPDRSSYISRLDQLERKMALFQRGLSNVVNKATALSEEENGDSFKLKALVNVYNNEHLSTSDRDQDSAAGDHRIRPLRKKSRRLSSPTRINAMLSHHHVL